MAELEKLVRLCVSPSDRISLARLRLLLMSMYTKVILTSMVVQGTKYRIALRIARDERFEVCLTS